jgi:dihydrofolate synthase / folylpolyglutamate synthase
VDYRKAKILTEADHPRAAKTSELAEAFVQMNVPSFKWTTQPHIQSCLSQSLSEARKTHQILIICGSFFIMSPIRKALGFQEPIDPIILQDGLPPADHVKKI